MTHLTRNDRRASTKLNATNEINPIAMKTRSVESGMTSSGKKIGTTSSMRANMHVRISSSSGADVPNYRDADAV